MFLRRTTGLLLLATLSGFGRLGAADVGNDDLRRQAAIAEFTRKTKDANYPSLFDQAAAEFKVPADLLKGIAFAETRWEHLTWPPGETVSSENGMPRPYGIMSLWDNKYFGHSLIEAAALINQDPEVLKADPVQNIRGAAALLRKLYDENPKPDGTTENNIESWRNAIRKYCGLPEPDLNAQHALNVYVFMSQGYHQFGIEWDSRPVNLEPIREETARIVAEEKARRGLIPPTNTLSVMSNSPRLTPGILSSAAALPQSPQPTKSVITKKTHANWFWFLCGLILMATLFWLRFKRNRPDSDARKRLDG
jgi:hypothetical protein